MEPTKDSQISSDPETKGFDLSAGKTWIYPENYPIRDYQYNIVQACLYKNTLVCLPTGLGKTFIGAVVMYNFWRWYPKGKVVFLAPTKPLVAQQIFACYNVMGIPSIETIELTGAINQKQREVAWLKKRVVFATPQVFYNDLYKKIVPADSIKCVVIDEAHKALGKHAYCECIRTLSETNKNFRVLALSATPGNKINNVHEVLQNLLIAHVELRDEASSDVLPYINQRKLDIILVPLNSEITKYKERYIFIMDRHVKILLHCNVLKGDTANISKGKIFHLLKEFQQKTNKSGNYGQIIKTLNILITMYHAYELMIRDGLRAFYKFYQTHSDKFWLKDEIQLQELLIDVEQYLGPFPEIKTFHEDDAITISQDLVYGHTKFEKLKELLLHHFENRQEKQDDTRAIVFVEYRDIVSEIYVLLLQCQPLIRPQMFVGQAGQKQKQQLKALEDFRNNRVNVLVSTSIGEEGLDVGEVDLIICFDVSQHSPTRLVQRMGRTGRKRDGHIIILVTDGKEHETLKSTMARRASLNNKILNTGNIFSSLYQNNPRMVPDTYNPDCMKMYISTQPKVSVTKGNDKKSRKTNKGRNTLKKITAIDPDALSQDNENKFSMTKFFKTKQPKEQVKNNISTCVLDTSHTKKAVKPSDVKLLSCDNAAVDFLTICALRNSENETDTKEKSGINKLYVPEFSRIKNFFNFSIPDIKILDCLITLKAVTPPNKNDLYKNENNSKRRRSSSHNDELVLVNAMKQVENKPVIEESKFEDLLDDSSESTDSNLFNYVKENCKNSHSNLTVGFEQQSNSNISKTIAENETGILQDLEPGIFEDILNETSDDSESTIHDENEQTEKFANDMQLRDTNNSNSEDLRKRIESNDVSTKVVQNSNKKDYKQIIEKDRTSIEPKKESILTITQAISEIGRLNSNSTLSNMVDESEDDMFQEESFSTQIDNCAESIKETNNLFKGYESNDKTVLDKSNNVVKKENETDIEFKLEEYEWDDDFKISTDPICNTTIFDSSRERINKSIKIERNVETQNDQSRTLINKSPSVLNRNTAGTSIARKLSNLRRSWSSRLESANKSFNNTCNSNNESFSAEKDDEEESSFFFNDSINNCDRDTTIETKHFENHNGVSRKRKRINEFIDDEAEVSSKEYVSDESSDEADIDLDGFVSYTQNVHETTDMHIHYLKSVKSPVKRHEGFVFKEPRAVDTSVETYLEPVTQADDTYLNDTFCVSDDENEHQDATLVEELCELERAEQELENRKRKRKRMRAKDQALNRNTKKRKSETKNYSSNNDSSSGEDEIENLRKQIMEESLLLARSRDRS
nr:PREDICTED: Fanconi anemia group M protein isoform X1 [Megachile rotundata]